MKAWSSHWLPTHTILHCALCIVHCSALTKAQCICNWLPHWCIVHCTLPIVKIVCAMAVKSGKNASSSRSEVSLFNPGIISLAEMKPNGGWIWSSLVEKVVKLPPAGGVRGQWAAAMAWIHLHTHWIHWIHLHTHTHRPPSQNSHHLPRILPREPHTTESRTHYVTTWFNSPLAL